MFAGGRWWGGIEVFRTTNLEICGREFEHTDDNELARVEVGRELAEAVPVSRG